MFYNNLVAYRSTSSSVEFTEAKMSKKITNLKYNSIMLMALCNPPNCSVTYWIYLPAVKNLLWEAQFNINNSRKRGRVQVSITCTFFHLTL